MELYAELDEYIPDFVHGGAGFRVLIHDQSVVPNPDQAGIDIPVAAHTNVGVRRVSQVKYTLTCQINIMLC